MTGGHYDEEGEPVLAEEAHEAAHRALDDEKRETEKRREITIEEAMDWRNQV